MMKKTFLLLMIACTCSCSSKSQTTGSWYKLLKGRINNYPVTMYLYALNHNYAGNYYYDSKQDPIYFNGTDSAMPGKIVLTTATSNNPETFTLSMDGKHVKGNWQQDKNTLQVSLSEAAMPVNFTYSGIADSAKLRPEMPASPRAIVQATSVWPTGNTASDELIKTQIRKLFADKQNSKDVRTLLQQYAKRFLNEYISVNKEATDEDLRDHTSTYAYDLSGDIHVDYQSAKFISFAFSVSTYTGGAHSNFGTSHFSADIVHNKLIRLSDVLTTNGIKQLRPLLEKQFRKNHNLQPNEPLTNGGLFDNKIEANRNFYVTGKGLVFSYNPYEIASYVTGEIELSIDYKALQNYIQPAFASLLK